MKPIKKKNIILSLILFIALSALLSGCGFFKISKTVVTFYDGEEMVAFHNVLMAEKVKAPDVPDKNGYRVVDWKDSEGVSFGSDYEFKDENDFYAVWSPISYTIGYDLNGGTNSPDNPDSYTVEDSFTLSDATKEDHEFLGWSTVGQATPERGLTVSVGTTGDLVFTANFAENDKYYLFFETNGGEGLERAVSNEPIFAIAPVPVRDGYRFNGWYKNEGLNVLAEFPLTVDDRITTVYADWQPIVYRVYAKNDEFEPIEFTVETDTFKIDGIERIGHDFIGFTDDDSSTIRSEYFVEKGTHKDITLTLHYRVKRYKLIFDTMGGSEISPRTYDFGAEISAPADPEKEGCEFLGWFTDPACENDFTFDKMPAEDVKLYAGWYSDENFTLRYSASDPDALIIGNRESGSMFLRGEKVKLYAPAFCNGGAFVYWTKGSAVFAYENDLEFLMPIGAVNLVANYARLNTYDYDKATGEDLVIRANATIQSVDGACAKSSDYSIRGETLTLNAEFLSGLECGYHTFIMRGTDDSVYVAVNVFNTASFIEELKIDYDVDYPNVVMTFKGEYNVAYEYSLDGSAYTLAQSGAVLYGYRKDLSHTLTLRRAGDHDDSAVVTKAAYPRSLEAYVNRSFEYGGNKYDQYIESKEEFDVAIKYATYVNAPVNRSSNNSVVFSFGLSSEFNSEISEKEEDYFCELFLKGGVPYAPSYSYALDKRNQIGRLSLTFRSERLNEDRSTQAEEPVSGAQALLKPSSRGESFDSFKIDGFEKTQKIRTVYELEDLPFGVKPVFEDTSAPAYFIYEKAREALRSYVDDTMNDFEKATAIFDYIALNYTYDDAVAESVAENDIGRYAAFTSYGFFKHKVAVCDGLASAYRIMCLIEGIECEEIAGMGKGGAHAWNKVKIYDKWYVVDTTWSHVSSSDGIFVTHRNFLCPEMVSEGNGHRENATVGEENKYVENVAIGVLDYYTIEYFGTGMDHTVIDADELYELLIASAENGVSAVEVRYAPKINNSFSSVLNQVRTIMLINFKRYSLNYYTLGDNLYIVTIN